jgi:hypothetical protein
MRPGVITHRPRAETLLAGRSAEPGLSTKRQAMSLRLCAYQEFKDDN